MVWWKATYSSTLVWWEKNIMLLFTHTNGIVYKIPNFRSSKLWYNGKSFNWLRLSKAAYLRHHFECDYYWLRMITSFSSLLFQYISFSSSRFFILETGKFVTTTCINFRTAEWSLCHVKVFLFIKKICFILPI